MDSFRISVEWPTGRIVHIDMRGISLTPDRARSVAGPISLLHEHVLSRAGFEEYLRTQTRYVDDGGTLECFGAEADIVAVLTLLNVDGKPTSPILVQL